MTKIDVIRNTYGGLNYLQNAVDYVLHERTLYKGGFGVNPYNTAMACDQMLAVKGYYGKTSRNLLVHIVIAYDSSVKDINTAARFGSSALSSSQVNFRCFIAHTKKIFNVVTSTHILSLILSAILTVK